MDIQVKPWPIFVRIRGPVEEDHLTFVPALIRLSYVRKVERCKSVRWVWADSVHTALVPLPTVCGVPVVPYVYGDLHSLKNTCKLCLQDILHFICIFKIFLVHKVLKFSFFYNLLFLRSQKVFLHENRKKIRHTANTQLRAIIKIRENMRNWGWY